MTDPAQGVPVVESVSRLAEAYDAWFCDVWGVVHNGVAAFPPAVRACERFRAAGGTVVLITNAPRPSTAVLRQLDGLHVPRAAYDCVVTSGDVTRSLLTDPPDRRVFHLGPERDLTIFDGLDVALVTASEASVVLCSGLYDDETETPDDYADHLSELRRRRLPMICANPDLMVERGDRLVYCAGALAAAYATLGGEVVYTGKPHTAIYELALKRASEARGVEVSRERVLAIGDGLKTDMAGAAAAGLDALFVASGLHLEGASRLQTLHPQQVEDLFPGDGFRPVAAQVRLAW